MFLDCILGALDEVRSQPALVQPALLPERRRLTRGQMRDPERGYIPGAMVQEELKTFLVHDIAMFDRVRAQAYSRLDGVGIGGMGHHRITALAADGKRGL